MSKGFYTYIVPTVLVDDLVKFTNDFTNWSCEKRTTIGQTTRITIVVDSFDPQEDMEILDAYVGRFIILFGRAHA